MLVSTIFVAPVTVARLNRQGRLNVGYKYPTYISVLIFTRTIVEYFAIAVKGIVGPVPADD